MGIKLISVLSYFQLLSVCFLQVDVRVLICLRISCTLFPYLSNRVWIFVRNNLLLLFVILSSSSSLKLSLLFTIAYQTAQSVKYGPDDCGSIPGRAKTLIVASTSRPDLGPAIPWISGTLSSGINRTKRETNHSLLKWRMRGTLSQFSISLHLHVLQD